MQHTKDKDLADSRLKSVFESIKEQEESLGYTLPEFKEALTAALNYEKVQALVDKKSEAIATVDILGL